MTKLFTPQHWLRFNLTFVATVILLLFPFLVKAGNYTTIANGKWSNSAIWSGGVVPGASDTATIAYTDTLDASESIKKITINSSKSLTVSSTSALTVYGNFTNNGTFTASSGTVTFVGSANQTISGSGTITFYNLTGNPSAVTDTIFLGKAITVSNNFTISQGVFACKQYAVTGNSTGTMTMASGTTLLLGSTAVATAVAFPSNFTSANITLNSNSNVVYQADATQTVSYVPGYGNLSITTVNAGTPSTSGTTLTVNGNLTVGTVTFNQNCPTAYMYGNLVINSGGTYNEHSTNTYFYKNITNNGTFGSGGYYIWMNGTSNQVIGGTSSKYDFFILKINNPSASDTVLIESSIQPSGVYVYTAVLCMPAGYTNDTIRTAGIDNVSGTVTTLSGVVYYPGASSYIAASSGLAQTYYKLTTTCNFQPSNHLIVTTDYTNTGWLEINNSGPGSITLEGDFINNGTMSAYGNVTFNGSHNQTIRGTNYTTFQNLVINMAASNDTVKLADSVSVTNSNFTITKGTFDVANYAFSVGSSFTNNGTFVARNGTVTFTGYLTSFPQPLGGTSVTTFNNLVLHPYGAGSSSVALTNNVIVKKNLTIVAGGFDANLTYNYSTTVGGDFTNNGTFYQRNGTVSLNGSTNQTISGTGTLAFYNLTGKQASATDTLFLGKAITVNHNLADSGGVFDCQNYQITGNATGTLTLAANTGLVLGLPSSTTNITFPTSFTTAHTTLNATSTVRYQANTAQTISTTPTYGNLVLASGTTATRKTPATTTLAIAGNLNINSNAVLLANTGTVNITGNLCNADSLIFTNGALNIGGNFTNNGAFRYGTGTVTLNGISGQTIGGTNSTTFYKLTGTSSGTETITLGNNESVTNNFLISSGTFTLVGGSYSLNVAGNFTNNGSLTASSGTVTMNGSTSQTIGGSAISHFYNLIVNGSSVVTLGNNQSVSQILNVASGSLNTSTYHIN